MVIFLLFLIPICRGYFIASTGGFIKQKTLMLQDIATCISQEQPLSLSQQRTQQFVCVNKMLSGCLLRESTTPQPAGEESTYRSGAYCGALVRNTKTTLFTASTIILSVMKGYFIHTQFLIFQFWSPMYTSCRQHGIIIFLEGRGELFCGKRPPWVISSLSQKLSVDIVIMDQKEYALTFFYSGYRAQWIKTYSYEVNMHLSSGALVNVELPLEHMVVGVTSYTYCIMTHHNKRVYVEVYWDLFVKSELVIYDGPGVKSSKLLQVYTNTRGNTIAQSSAFLAFFKITTHQGFVRNSSMFVNVYNVDNTDRNVQCIQLRRRLFSIKAFNYNNTVCSGKYKLSRGFMTITFRDLNFSGPNNIMGDMPDPCHYGGVVIEFVKEGKRVKYCNNIKNMSVYSNSWLYFTIIYFSGYSTGHLSGEINKDDCPTFYAELRPPGDLYKADIRLKINAALPCQIIVCPPLVNASQKTCTVELGPDPIGTITIRSGQQHTLGQCDPHLEELTEEQTSYNITTTITKEWPFGLPIQQRDINYTLGKEKFIKYLHNGTISINMLCIEKHALRHQTYVFLEISICRKREEYHRYERLDSNNIPALSESCLNYIYTFTPVKQIPSSKNTYDFIYKGRGYENVNTGHIVDVEYVSCPNECRKYKYSVLVRESYYTIREYTSEIGGETFTGYYHRGFMVSVMPPISSCNNLEVCSLSVQIKKLSHQIGVFPPLPLKLRLGSTLYYFASKM